MKMNLIEHLITFASFSLTINSIICNTFDHNNDLQSFEPTMFTNETNFYSSAAQKQMMNCQNGLLTFEISTGFIYKPSSVETLAMMPSTLQLTDCLNYCLNNSSCLAINFEVGLCVLLSSSADQSPQNLYSSQFPVFTIYAEKKCLLEGHALASKQKRKCQRAWTFERVAGYEMKIKPRRRLKLASKEQCMDACLLEREFECRSANWYRRTSDCSLSDQDRHSVTQSEAGDQQINRILLAEFYGPSTNFTNQSMAHSSTGRPDSVGSQTQPKLPLYQNYYMNKEALQEKNASLSGSPSGRSDNETLKRRKKMPALNAVSIASNALDGENLVEFKYRTVRQLYENLHKLKNPAISATTVSSAKQTSGNNKRLQLPDDLNSDFAVSNLAQNWPMQYYQAASSSEMPADASVDYLENNCIYEPNKLCEFRKIQNRVLKTVDSIYQDINSLEECKMKCLKAPYRCYSFDYNDTSEKVCRTSHLDQASLLSVKEPYLDVVGAITYELASCFNVSIQCRAKEMITSVSSSKVFKGKIYVKSRPNSCVNDVKESLQFNLIMKYHDENCNVQNSSDQFQGVFSNDIIIQNHDRIVTTQDVGLSVYCQYDLRNKSITNNVDLAIEKLEDNFGIESKTKFGNGHNSDHQMDSSNGLSAPNRTQTGFEAGSLNSPLTITSLATTVVKSPNVTMRITNMNGQPVTSATVGDRLALLFEIKEKTSPFGIFVREIIAMDGKQLLPSRRNPLNSNLAPFGHNNSLITDNSIESIVQENKAQSIQFIDSDGCPTDANIMGPLIRMDGHRILAPFDAFKFPTSEMVFFKAVVTSCVSECKPALCDSRQQQHLFPGLFSVDTSVLEQAQTSPMAGTSTTTSAAASANQEGRGSLIDLLATPSMPAAAATTTATTSGANLVNYKTSPYSYNHISTSQNLVTRPSPRQSTTMAPETSERVSPAAPNGDSLTTVPGFNVTQKPYALATTNHNYSSVHQLIDNSPNSSAANQPESSDSSNSSTVLNHYHSRPYLPRPSGLSSGTQLGGSLNLSSLSREQKLQLVKLFENKLKQASDQSQAINDTDKTNLVPNNGNNLSELADLYTGFLTSVMLNSEQQQNVAGSELAATKHPDESANYKRQPDSGSAHAALSALASGQLNLTNANPENALQSISDQELSLVLNLMKQQIQEIKEPKLKGSNVKRDTRVGEATGSGNGQLSGIQIRLEGGEAGANLQRQPVNKSEDEIQGIGKHRSSSASSNSNVKTINQQSTKQKQLRDKQQAFADSYMGAFHSFGRRRKRDLTDEEEFVLMEQEQKSTRAPSGGDAQTTKAFVVMYHIDPSDLSGHNAARFKRQVLSSSENQGPMYDMDEMIIQSIKIIDRVESKADDSENESSLYRKQGRKFSSQQRKTAIERQKSLPRSSLVIGDVNSPTNNKSSSENLWLINSAQHLGDNQKASSDANGADDLPEEGVELGAQEAAAKLNLIGWSSTSVFYLIIVASTFILIQVLVVMAYCCLNLMRRLRSGRQNYNRALMSSCSSLVAQSESCLTISSPTSTLSAASMNQPSILRSPLDASGHKRRQFYLVPEAAGRSTILPDQRGNFYHTAYDLSDGKSRSYLKHYHGHL